MTRFDLILRNLSTLFRFVEFCLALLLLSWTFSRLSFAVRNSGEYFRRLFVFVTSPLFGFLLCNTIIAALIANKPVRFRFSSGDDPANKFYQEFVKNSGDHHYYPRRFQSLSETDSASSESKEIVFQDKEIVSEVKTTTDHQNAEMDDHLKVHANDQTLDLEGSLYDEEEMISNAEFQQMIEEFIDNQLRFRREETL